MQQCEAGNGVPDIPQPLRYLFIFDRAGFVEHLPGFRHGRLLGYYPRMQGASDVPEFVQSIECAHATTGDAHQSNHLAFKLVEAQQVERVLQYSAEAAVIFRRAQDEPIRLSDGGAQAIQVGYGGIAAVGEG
jgi:hypothetical protein